MEIVRLGIQCCRCNTFQLVICVPTHVFFSSIFVECLLDELNILGC
jgi:hypothetical protein